MRRSVWVSAVTSLLASGCNSSSLGGRSTSMSGAPSSPPSADVDPHASEKDPGITIGSLNSAIPIPGNKSGDKILDVDTPFEVDQGSVDLSFDAGFADKAADSVSLRSLVVYFVLDVSASMDSNIATIKQGIQSFAAKLVAKKFDAKVGYVTFKDSIGTPSDLMDAATLSNNLSSVTTTGGDDANEGSLSAFRQALNAAVTKGSADAVKALLTITDNPGHNDNKDGDPTPGTTRDCSIDQVVKDINALPPGQQNLVKIYHSVSTEFSTSSTSIVKACGGFNSAREQWDAILNKSLPGVPLANRGGALSYPFNGDVLEKDFVRMLETTSPGADLVCLVKKAQLFAKENLVDETTYENSAESYKEYAEGRPFIWKEAIPENRLAELLKSTKNTLKLSSCCLLKTAAEAGQFGTCEQEKTVIVNFKVKLK